MTKNLAKYNEDCVLIDEVIQDEELFGDFWENNEGPIEEMIKSFQNSWRDFIEKHHGNKVTYIFDNALMNQVQYLMALGAARETIEHFFRDVLGQFTQVEVRMLFLDGNSEIIIKRINNIRTNGWGKRVSELVTAFPYQLARKRTGLEGMVSLFADGQALKRQLLADWPFPLVTIDVTDADWERYQQQAVEFLARY